MKSCYIVAAAELAPERLRPEPGDLLIAAGISPSLQRCNPG